MTDTLLHILLGAIYGLVLLAVFSFLPEGTAAGLSGALFIYLREVTQRQTSHDLSFEKGWNPFGWTKRSGELNVQKVKETIIPAGVLILAGVLIDVIG